VPKAAGPGSLRVVARMRQDQFQPWPIFWSQRRHARLVGPTLALMNDRKEIALESVFGQEFAPDDPSARMLWLPAPLRIAGAWTSVCSRWSEGFYHWFMDVLPRLAVLADFPPETGILGPPLRFQWQRDTLRWLGLESRWRETTEKHLQVENYWFSGPVAMTGCDNPYALRFLHERLAGFADAAYRGPQRFYLTRRGRARSPVNEPEIEALMAAAGWAVIDPEQLTLAQQMSLFSGADAIVAPHGGALVNMAWCRPGTCVLELCADNFLNGCYEGMAVHLDLQHDFLIAPADAAFRLRVPTEALVRKLGI